MRVVPKRGRAGNARADERRFGVAQPGQRRSLVNETAHQQFRQGATDEEGRCLPRYVDESDIGLCRALEQLRQPLRFDQLVGRGFSPQENPANVTRTGRDSWSTAMSGHVMRGGRHFIEFAIALDEEDWPCVNLGVIRPVSLTNDNDVEADWRGRVDPMFVSSNRNTTAAEKLRSQRTTKWGRQQYPLLHLLLWYWKLRLDGLEQ